MAKIIPKLADSLTHQCQHVDSDGERCPVRRMRLGRSGYCKQHQQEQDEDDLNSSNRDRFTGD